MRALATHLRIGVSDVRAQVVLSPSPLALSSNWAVQLSCTACVRCDTCGQCLRISSQ